MKTHLTAVFVVALCLLGVGAAVGCTPGPARPDPRSVKGTTMSLDQAVAKYGIPLPDCTLDGLSYFAGNDPYPDFGLTFSADQNCVSTFLSNMGSRHVVNEKGYDLPFNTPQFTEDWHWKFDNMADYEVLHGGPLAEVIYDLVITTHVTPTTVYIRAFPAS